MTFVKNEKKNLKNILLALFTLPLIFAIMIIVAFYNQTVNLKHSVTDMKIETQKTESESAELKNKLFVMFDQQNVESLAKARGLVKETKPTYLEANPWALASHL